MAVRESDCRLLVINFDIIKTNAFSAQSLLFTSTACLRTQQGAAMAPTQSARQCSSTATSITTCSTIDISREETFVDSNKHPTGRPR